MESVDDKRFAIIQYSDGGTGLINLQNVKRPRKDVQEYKNGDYIHALYQKQLWRARISEVHHDRKYLAQQCIDGMFPVNHKYDEDSDMDEEEQADGDKIMSVTPKRKAEEVPGGSSKRIMIDIEASTGATSHSVPFSTVAAASSAFGLAPVSHSVPSTTVAAASSAFGLAPVSHSVPSTTVAPASSVFGLAPEYGVSTTSVSQMTSPKSKSKLERKVSHLERDVLSLKTALSEIQKRIENLEAVKESSGTVSSNSSTGESEAEGTKVEELLMSVSHLQPTSEKATIEILRRITLKIFSREDLVNCSRTGKATNKSPVGGSIRPSLDGSKFNLLERAVLMKCPLVPRETFIKKFDNIVKMERRAAKKQ